MPRRLLASLICVGALIGTAEASCGLDQCPPSAAPGTAHAVVAATRVTSVASQVWTEETFVGASFALSPVFRAEATLPAVWLRYRGTSVVGLGNAVALVDAAWPVGIARIGGGFQLELPTATSEYLGDRHFLGLPYLKAQLQSGLWQARARGGWGAQLGASVHGHPGPNMNPHASSELLWRVDGQWGDRVRPGLGLDGVHTLTGEAQTLLAVVPRIGVTLGTARLGIEAQVPVTRARRFRWRGLMSLRVPVGARSS
ncbi:MAG: hypothetical protein KC912_11205 [Proteobacteria bacterium]|nr:hypothetical protein [Pseudomonadota bacterium]